MSQPEDTRQTVRTLLRQQQFGVLSTVANDAPYASLVAYAASEDDRYLYFVTPRATRKYANISANARVALLVSSSRNQLEDIQQAAAVTALGAARSVPSSDRDAVLSVYQSKHPGLEAFVRSPDSELMEIIVSSYILVERFQTVSEYRIDHDLDHAII
jgi:nitroimidazol reductase NimA-like FMN-containing flavoprotein (pyridoxamine 5'-phosphate oxidase superfamily)